MIFYNERKGSCTILLCFIFFIACHSNKSESTETQNITDSAWLLPFNKLDSVNPVMQPGNLTFQCPVQNKLVKWEAKNVYNPAVAVKDDTLFMLYRAQDSAGCSRVGVAKSVDGIHFTRHPLPVLYPDNDAYKKYEWPGGCEDPRLIQDSAGTYYITYTAYDGKTARLMIATSTDLYHWQKHGPVFTDAKYENMWSKSGSVISNYTGDKIVAAKINGLYWMYWGDKYIWTATSPDLIHWSPAQQTPDKNYDSVYAHYNISSLQIAIPTRRHKFDCDLVESGPPAMLTAKGILLIYNSRNIPAIGDTSLREGTYTVSQVLLDKNDPSKIIDRMNGYFLKPEQPYEFSGEVNNVCFAEGLALYKNKWWLYYGTADSKIAVAQKTK
ncbi:MAG TPA: glycoside hydrolase family 130 protein [Parafilimonas sp.]|nr:glycoside hydrolase family 130 protein [Parafilimonas sp.]